MSLRVVLSRPLSPLAASVCARSYHCRVASELTASTSCSSSQWLSQHRALHFHASRVGRLGFGNHSPREPGVRAMASVAGASAEAAAVETEEEELAFWERIVEHQRTAARLPHLEEARLVVGTSVSGILSTNSQKYEGYPTGSLIDFAADDEGRPILAISTLSQHTRDLEANPRCSLLVPRDPLDKSDTTITLIGDAIKVSAEEEAGVRAAYLKKLPKAFWVDFGDFRLLRLEPKGVRYVTGIATGAAAVGNYSGEDYKAATLDRIAAFSAPVAGHMNKDHADDTKLIVETAVGIKVDRAEILSLDRLGLTVEVSRKGGLHKLRVPFPRPAVDRKDLKTVIVEMLKDGTPGVKAPEDGKSETGQPP